MSSILGLLTEYGVWPRVTNASALTDSIKVQILHLLLLIFCILVINQPAFLSPYCFGIGEKLKEI